MTLKTACLTAAAVGLVICLRIVYISAKPNMEVINGSAKKLNATPEEFITTYSQHRLASDFMLSLFRNLSKGISLSEAVGRPPYWRNIQHTDTVRSIPATGIYQTNQQSAYNFNMSQININERLRVAELRVEWPSTWGPQYQLYALAVTRQRNQLTYISSIPTITHYFATDKIIIVDVTTMVKSWLDFVQSTKTEDFTLELVFISADGGRKSTTRSKLLRQMERFYTEESINLMPSASDGILVTYTQAGDLLGKTSPQVQSFLVEKVQSAILEQRGERENANVTPTIDSKGGDVPRTKRSRFSEEKLANEDLDRTMEIEYTSMDRTCRRTDMPIDFSAMGWGEWVVYPTHFNAFQCTGKCGGFTDSRNNPTNHAIVQSLVRLVSRTVIPISCCTPTKLSPLSILYLEKDSVVIKHHEEMIADECGCM